MANTYSQVYIQIVFAVRFRRQLIPREKKEEVHQYIGSIIKKRGHKPLAIHCMPDHIHIFIGLKPSMSISDLVKDIKTNSSSFINRQSWMKYGFQWQTGFGVFSYGRSQISDVCRYIENQEEHHKKQTFRKEYHDFLDQFDIDYDEKYLFDWVGD